MLEEIKGELVRWGARVYDDGRLNMGCPITHSDGHCDCYQAFYWSPFSGRWWCFCADHPRRKPDRSCVNGAAWSLWGALFPGRKSPKGETSTSSPLGARGKIGTIRPQARTIR